MKRLLFITLASISVLTTSACRCYKRIFSEEVAQSDQIFVGTVLKKTALDQVYYLFSVSESFKGNTKDTITIKTGFGGTDCGMVFDMTKTYLVYAAGKQTTFCGRNALASNNSDCGRNALASNNSDLIKLKYLFDTTFSGSIGKTTEAALTENEAVYLNSLLTAQRMSFDFRGKEVAFVYSNPSLIDKLQYFQQWGGRDAVHTLIILSEKEKQEFKDYDAVIVLWLKKTVSEKYRRRLLNQLR